MGAMHDAHLQYHLISQNMEAKMQDFLAECRQQA